ncbi:hypothetical protein BD410DRAFT_798625 [Rickenella mellea]|uniref:Uncharacterized protein n=1 Tax=Rickenella mellea TaxID=50990 RepID=A0A4Y7QM29_9AGAM|nr:hypothetical protein BD410DRAFT_798625 [Rickenella mellea]
MQKNLMRGAFAPQEPNKGRDHFQRTFHHALHHKKSCKQSKRRQVTQVVADACIPLINSLTNSLVAIVIDEALHRPNLVTGWSSYPPTTTIASQPRRSVNICVDWALWGAQVPVEPHGFYPLPYPSASSRQSATTTVNRKSDRVARRGVWWTGQPNSYVRIDEFGHSVSISHILAPLPSLPNPCYPQPTFIMQLMNGHARRGAGCALRQPGDEPSRI